MRKHEVKILKYCIIASIFILSLIISFFCYLHYKKYHYINNGKIIAEIDNYKIHENDILVRLKYLSKQFNKDIKLNELDKEIFKALILEEYLDNKIIDLANKKKMNTDNIKLLSNDYYKKLVVKSYIDRYVFSSVSKEDIKKRYDELVSEIKNKEEREIYHILLNTQEEAERTLNLIKRNGNFETIAKKRSLDKASAINGGNMGYLIKEEISIPEFASVAFILKQGEISKPVETKEGWHLIKINDIRNIQPKSFEDSQAEIFENLKQERYSEFLKNFKLNNLEKNIKFIEYQNNNLKNENSDEISNLINDLEIIDENKNENK